MSRAQQDNLLTSGAYDNDAASLRSNPDYDPDSEDEHVSEESRTSLDLYNHGSTVLREEEERENLLRKRGPFDRIKRAFTDSSNNIVFKPNNKEARRRRRKERRTSGRGLKRETAQELQIFIFRISLSGPKEVGDQSESGEGSFEAASDLANIVYSITDFHGFG